MESGGAQTFDVFARLDAAFAHERDLLWEFGREVEGGLKRSFERAQVAVVDAEHPHVVAERLLNVHAVVDFDQRVEAHAVSDLQQVVELRALQDRGDQQYRVGAGVRGLVNLVFVEDEVLTQQRQRRDVSHTAQVVERAAEEILFGQTRNGRRAVGGVIDGDA